MAVLKAKLTSSSTLRKVVLEGRRIGAPEALALDIVDDLGGDGQEVVDKAIKLGEAQAPKAQAEAWGLIKVRTVHLSFVKALLITQSSLPQAAMYKEAIAEMATDRGSDGIGASVLARL